jgi:hypothetical protein
VDIATGSRSLAPTIRSFHCCGELVDDVGDDLEQRLQLVVRAAQVLGGQQPQGDHPDTCLAAPIEQVGDVRRTGPVPLGRVAEPGLAGPAPVAVEHHPDVVRDLRAQQLPGELAFVDAVDQRREPHGR